VLVIIGVIVGIWHDQIAGFFGGETDITTQTPVIPTTPGSDVTDIPAYDNSQQSAVEIERLTFELINEQRQSNGMPATVWDDELYVLSKAHTEEMLERGEMFHSLQSASYAENCWEGHGYQRFGEDELAGVIVESWLGSPLHRAWLLHMPIRHSTVSIVVSEYGQYASWTFWRDEIGLGPELVRQIADEWRRETGESIPWIEWLYMKGYLE